MDIQKEREAFRTWGATHPDNPDITAYEEGIMFDAWLAAKAQAVPELTSKMIVAIESEVESQLKASAIDADPFRLDGEKIWHAALEAQEPK